MNKIIFDTKSFTQGQFTTSWHYLTDAEGQPCFGEMEIFDDKVACESSEKEFSYNALLEAGDFGKVMLRTRVFKADGSKKDLLESLVGGRINQIEEELKKIEKKGIFTARLLRILTLKSDKEKLQKLMWLGEEIVQEKSQKKLKDRIGKGEMKDFLVGGQAFGIEKGIKYQNVHKELFELGIAPLYFFLLKPDSRNKTNWELTDKIVDWLVKTKRPIKGHPLVWMHKYARPEWMLSLSFSELKRFLKEHITEVIARYGDRIKMWDIVNEIPASDANGFDLTMDQLLEITKMTSGLVKKLQPEAERIINFSEIFGAGSYVNEKPSIPPVHFLKLCEKNKIEYESIGLQFYMGMKKEFACRELLNISQTVDTFTKFGKNIHFSELGWPSKHDVDPLSFFSADHPEVAGRWHRGWDEELQAEFLKKIYTLFASKPRAKSITWWDITDNGPHEDIGSRFIPFAGLTRRNFTPKPAYVAIKNFKSIIKRSTK
jgi:GH35 family endo-1,4-beta-xylanase